VEAKKIIGANVRAQRKERDWTQERLAIKAGMHLNEVGRVERGVRDMRVSTVAKLAKALGIPAMELLRGI